MKLKMLQNHQALTKTVTSKTTSIHYIEGKHSRTNFIIEITTTLEERSIQDWEIRVITIP